MEEEDSAQSFSMESEQPGMKRTKDSNKDGKKKKKRHSAQDAGSESGRSSPLVGVHLGADGYTVTVTPAHTGQEEFHLISAVTSSPKEDHSKGKDPAERKTPKSTISFTAVAGSSQSVLTGKPKAPKPQGKSKTPKSSGKPKATIPPGKSETPGSDNQSSSSFFVSADVHNEDGASEEAAEEDQED